MSARPWKLDCHGAVPLALWPHDSRGLDRPEAMSLPLRVHLPERPARAVSAEQMNRTVVQALFDRARWLIAEDSGSGNRSDTRCELSTWERARVFLLGTAAAFGKATGSVLPMPVVASGPDGSADLHWEREEYELLVNIPANPDESASFYGDDYGKTIIKGFFDPGSVQQGIMAWFMRK